MVTVVSMDHTLHGGGGLGGRRERSPPDVVFPLGHAGYKHNRLAQMLLDLLRSPALVSIQSFLFCRYANVLYSNKVFTR